MESNYNNLNYDIIFDLLKCETKLQRFGFILDLVHNNFPTYYIDHNGGTPGDRVNNIIIPGYKNCNTMLIAHYDVVDIRYCANDNSASIVNVLMYKLQNPEIHVVLVDKEEPPYFGRGSLYLLNSYPLWGNINYVLNLELTGYGDNICIGNYCKGKLHNLIVKKLKCKDIHVNVVDTPFNDSTILNDGGVDSEVLFLLPSNNTIEGEHCLDLDIIGYCHTNKDNYSIINVKDMENLVENILPTILKN